MQSTSLPVCRPPVGAPPASQGVHVYGYHPSVQQRHAFCFFCRGSAAATTPSVRCFQSCVQRTRLSSPLIAHPSTLLPRQLTMQRSTNPTTQLSTLPSMQLHHQPSLQPCMRLCRHHYALSECLCSGVLTLPIMRDPTVGGLVQAAGNAYGCVPSLWRSPLSILLPSHG